MTPIRNRPISRRAFVRGAIGLAVAGVAASLGGTALGLGRPVAPARRLAGLVSHRDSAVAVGREALRQWPAEADVGTLLAALCSSVPDLGRLLAEGSDDDLRAALDSASRRDFAQAGDGLVRLQGWVASRTEARLSAIAVLA